VNEKHDFYIECLPPSSPPDRNRTYIHRIEHITRLHEMVFSLSLLLLLLGLWYFFDVVVMEWPAEAHLGLWFAGWQALYAVDQLLEVVVS
jgi:hypothetical protein